MTSVKIWGFQTPLLCGKIETVLIRYCMYNVACYVHYTSTKYAC